jgi:exonuclease VII small subunit
MSSRIHIVTITLALASLAFQAAAQQREALKACEADIKTYCAGVERGEGRIGKCLKENQEKLSKQCKTQLQAAAGRMKERRGQQDKPGPTSSTPN